MRIICTRLESRAPPLGGDPVAWTDIGAPSRAPADGSWAGRLRQTPHAAFKYGGDRTGLMGAANRLEWTPPAGIGPGAARMFPSDPGVYVLAEGSAAGAVVRYVGRASDLQRRIGGHLARSDNDCLRDVLGNATGVRISVTVQASETAQMNIEHTCYRHYLRNNHPLCNDAEPEGRYLGRMTLPF